MYIHTTHKHKYKCEFAIYTILWNPYRHMGKFYVAVSNKNFREHTRNNSSFYLCAVIVCFTWLSCISFTQLA